MVARSYDINTDDIRKQEYNVVVLPVDLSDKEYIDINSPLSFRGGMNRIFYSQIELTDCEGFVVSNTNFGANNCNITINGGGAIMFANNMHQAAPTISITDNQHAHFANCYVRSTGAVVSA